MPRAHALSVPGAAHVARGQPCQDASRALVESGYAVLALADGHGAPQHSRSAEGAALAVEVCCELLTELARELAEDRPDPALLERRLREHLPRRLCWSWNLGVRRLLRRPEHGAWGEDLGPFGTTVIGALLAPEFSLFLQIGDGGVLLLEGELAQRPLPHDPELVGGRTWSLALPEAWRTARLSCRPRSAGLWLMCTDGVSQSAEDPELEQLARWLRATLREEGWEPTVRGLPQRLAEWSRRSGGDDTSLAMLEIEP